MANFYLSIFASPLSPLFGLAVVFLIVLPLDQVTPLRDDWYSFASFEDTSEWETTYSYTCAYRIDLFREPREVTRRDRLQARRELQTPIRFRSEDTIKSPDKLTLHIYNNQPVRGGYSISYGFPRNKECLHGQDAECVVHPELGNVRSLVLSAERFKSDQNLNYIKDHFLIEKAEQFVTIINGGSIFERKFYEAVFLGGYHKDPLRSSHQVDGKKYPLEIYMYFLDETVPSVSLATILVVPVEESKRDNVEVKPIISAIEVQNGLYNKERRYLVNLKEVTRRERLYHHLRESTYYDVYDTGNNAVRNVSILQEPLASSVIHEAIFTRYVEPFEKMQALEAELFFLLEDYDRVQKAYDELWADGKDILQRRGNKLFPANNTEMHIIALVGAYHGLYDAEAHRKLKNSTTGTEGVCSDLIDEDYLNNFYNGPEFAELAPLAKFPTDKEHFQVFVNITIELCNHFDNYFHDIYFKNQNGTRLQDKYQTIRNFYLERVRRNKEMNKMIYEHFEDPAWGHDPTNNDPRVEKPDYANEWQKYEIADGIFQMTQNKYKLDAYTGVKTELEELISTIATKIGYANEGEMREVIQYLKHGTKTNDLKYHRTRIYEDFLNRQLPEQKKKRTLVELGGMELTEEEIDIYEKLSPIKVTVEQSFQISWLMPANGGYYHYSGSSPIPPCFRADNVILFKNSIKMSRRQIEVLTRIPTSFHREQDIRFTTPRVYDTRFEVDLSGADTEKSRIAEVRIPIYEQKKSHLFLGHDGLHKNAVDEWEKLEKKRRERMGGAEGVGKIFRGMMTAMLIIAFSM